MIPRPLKFSKLNSAGNDFICIDNTEGVLDELLASPAWSDFVAALCRRGLAVGADGVILACEVGSGEGVHVVARFLEPDGTEARLCGNGTACFAYWAMECGLVQGPEIRILTAAGTAQARVKSADPRRLTVCVPDPKNLARGITVELRGETWVIDHVDTGVPHAIAYVDHLDRLDVAHWGKALRHCERFPPPGVNANFVEVLGTGHIAVRTFEFGVEAETLACGTGSAAAAILTTLRYDWPDEFRRAERPVRVRVRSGDELLVWFVCKDGARATDVCLETVVRPIYNAELRDEFVDAFLSR